MTRIRVLPATRNGGPYYQELFRRFTPTYARADARLGALKAEPGGGEEEAAAPGPPPTDTTQARGGIAEMR